MQAGLWEIDRQLLAWWLTRVPTTSAAASTAVSTVACLSSAWISSLTCDFVTNAPAEFSTRSIYDTGDFDPVVEVNLKTRRSSRRIHRCLRSAASFFPVLSSLNTITFGKRLSPVFYVRTRSDVCEASSGLESLASIVTSPDSEAPWYCNGRGPIAPYCSPSPLPWGPTAIHCYAWDRWTRCSPLPREDPARIRELPTSPHRSPQLLTVPPQLPAVPRSLSLFHPRAKEKYPERRGVEANTIVTIYRAATGSTSDGTD